MTTNYPFTPSPKLVQHWYNVAREHKPDYEFDIATQAARWGADQELEACCVWIHGWYGNGSREIAGDLRTARRPKPPSLKEQALATLPENTEAMAGFWRLTPDDVVIIRRALEQLPND